MQVSSTAAQLSVPTLATLSALVLLSVLILVASAVSNRFVLALLLYRSLDLASSFLAALLCALTLMANFWAYIFSVYLASDLSIFALPPPNFYSSRRIPIPFVVCRTSLH